LNSRRWSHTRGDGDEGRSNHVDERVGTTPPDGSMRVGRERFKERTVSGDNLGGVGGNEGIIVAASKDRLLIPIEQMDDLLGGEGAE
jgi:hypothetical protein